MLSDERAQVSAELILLVGALLVIVIVAGGFVFNMSSDIAGNATKAINAGRETSIQRL